MILQFFKNSCLLLLVFTALFSAGRVQAQTKVETEVSPVKKIEFKRSVCFVNQGNAVIDEAAFREITARENCAELKETLNVDFAKHTLVTYRVGGDCFMRVSAKTFRNDAEKEFTVRIENFWGGCRAGGSVRGWIVLDKIPAGFKVAFSEVQLDDLDNKPSGADFELLPKQSDLPENLEILPTRETDLKGCVQTHRQPSFVIKDRADLEDAVRKDASRAFCLENLDRFDFDKYSLLGIEIKSGYCRRPVGLEFQTVKDEKNRKYILKIRYEDPKYAICRAVSNYDLWILVPKIPDGFDVVFDVEPEQQRDSD